MYALLFRDYPLWQSCSRQCLEFHFGHALSVASWFELWYFLKPITGFVGTCPPWPGFQCRKISDGVCTQPWVTHFESSHYLLFVTAFTGPGKCQAVYKDWLPEALSLGPINTSPRLPEITILLSATVLPIPEVACTSS